MSYQGLVTKFPTDRALTTQDQKYSLKQNVRLEVKPYADLVTIKLNSTYMEVVDKFYALKGQITGFAGLILICLCAAMAYFWVDFALKPGSDSFYPWVATIAFLPVAAFALWGVLKECFAHTHYPIRLNRKTQVVHVFRLDGSVLSVPWNEVFFTLDFQQEVAGRVWEIRGHVLDADGETVRETFGLGAQSSGDAEGLRMLRSHWEFYRRYMEDGPQAVVDCLKACMPVDGRRESFRFGYERIFVESSAGLGHPLLYIMWLLMLPMNLLSVLGRWVAMQTSKIPKWPATIEAVNLVAPDDPHVVDARINPPSLRK